MEYNSDELINKTVREISYPLFSGKGWLKFYGIITIIGGVLSALSIFGIIYAWIPVWMGVLIYSTANKIETAYYTGDKIALMEAQKKLNTYFIINAVLILISIIIVTLVIIAILGGAFAGYWNMIQDQIDSNQVVY